MKLEKPVNRNVILLITTVVSLMTAFLSSSVNIALPAVGKEFLLDAVQLGWVNTSFLLASAVFLIPMGRIGDLTGRKKIFLAGITVFFISSILSVLSWNGWSLILSRAVQGLGGSMIFATSGAIVVSVFPPEKRGRAIGINTASVYIGLAAGPFLGGVLTQAFGWRSIFIASAVAGLAVIPAVLLFMKREWAEAKGEKLDWTGSLIYAVSLSLLIYGFSLLPGMPGMVLTALGLGGIAVFCFWEMKAEYPVLNIRLFLRNRVFAFSNIAAMINYSATFSVVFFLSLYLQYVRGMTPRMAGTVLVLQPVVQAILSPVAGRISDRVEPRFLTSAGMALCAAGLLMLAFIDGGTGILYILVSLFLLGAGFALFSSPNTNAVMGSVERKYYGIASATLGTMRLVGQMFSMAAALVLFAVIIGRVRIGPEYSVPFLKAMKTGFGVFAFLCATGIFFSLNRGNLHSGTKGFKR